MKRLIRVLSSISAFLLLLAQLPVAVAEDSAAYNVEEWGSLETGGIYFRLTKDGDWPIGEASFCTHAKDRYINTETGSDIIITFYEPYNTRDYAETEAFCSYLKTEKTENGCVYWYTFNDEFGQEKPHVITVEGWDMEDESLEMPALWNKNPWVNDEGTQLRLEYIELGNQVSNMWNYIWEKRGCSTAIWYQRGNPYGGYTVGFAFREGEDLHTVRRYCPVYTW